MSFILNALRKSEQERQALQAETVNSKILPAQPQQNYSKTTKLLVFLVFANVLMIVGFVWFIRNNLMSPPDITAAAISSQLPVQKIKLEPEASAKATQPEKTEPDVASIAELIDEKKPEPAPLPVKPVIAKKPVTNALKQPAAARNSELPVTAAEVQADTPEIIPSLKDIPFLSDLPFNFRQTVPQFTINVFVYSQAPEERFVMIDMIKYKTGQQIKDAMELKEIRPDSLVVVYQNQEFQIKRP